MMIARRLFILNLLLGFTLNSFANNFECEKKQKAEAKSIENHCVSLTNHFNSGINFYDKVSQIEYADIEIGHYFKSPDSKRNGLYGLINISAGNIRKSPQHYSELVSQELMGTPIKVLNEKEGWYYIQTPNGYTGWIDGPGISLRTEEEMKELSKQTFGIFAKQYGQVYKSKDKLEVVSDIVLGDILNVNENLTSLYGVTLPDGRKGYVEKEGMISLLSIFYQSKVDMDEMIVLSKSLMGVSYLWGGKSSKGIDCSGFTSILYFFSGVILQRDASQQFKHGETITVNENVSNLKPGDLLFFGRKDSKNAREKVTHVGLYIGKGEFIHSSGFVHISKFYPHNQNLDNSGKTVFLGIKRIIGSIGSPGIQRIEDNELYKYFLKSK